ncbi:hypothetical protein DPMN_099258 [Dreissena polymorpha]|uniref:Uncharacterized protein n=1 Tax=Dreissena polymorpha TaxID=45954 RepID=A0A9D4R692_DREPO|nr:hypothetical protein DPMN_099258 [Dreissena polymorpha]
MEQRSRQLSDTLSRPPFMAGRREKNELFEAVAFEPTPRCRSASNTPTGLDTTNKVGFPPVPHLNQADFDEEARDFAGDRLFAPIPQRGIGAKIIQGNFAPNPTHQQTTTTNV